MKNTKGFTLIELLAVIAILAVITLVVVPLVINTVDNSKKEAFKDTGHGLIKAVELDLAQRQISNETLGATYLFADYVDNSPTKLNFSGSIPKDGKIVVKNDGTISLAIFDGKNCAVKFSTSTEVAIIENLNSTDCLSNADFEPLVEFNTSSSTDNIEVAFDKLNTVNLSLDYYNKNVASVEFIIDGTSNSVDYAVLTTPLSYSTTLDSNAGATALSAKRTCKETLVAKPDATNGVYWIKPETTAFQVYCNMTDGGRMLLDDFKGSKNSATDNYGFAIGKTNIRNGIDLANAGWTYSSGYFDYSGYTTIQDNLQMFSDSGTRAYIKKTLPSYADNVYAEWGNWYGGADDTLKIGDVAVQTLGANTNAATYTGTYSPGDQIEFSETAGIFWVGEIWVWESITYNTSNVSTGNLKYPLSDIPVGTHTYEFKVCYDNGSCYETDSRTIVVKQPSVYIFNYTGTFQTFNVPATGSYKLEVWGAQGGGAKDYANVDGGYGGYSTGTKNLTVGSTLYLYVGGKGVDYETTPGWNGGGVGGSGWYGSGGGGATDIRLNGLNLTDRIIVAGGGGGSFMYEYHGMRGGSGGGLTGGDGLVQSWYFGSNPPVPGGSQTSGGTNTAKGVLGIGGNAIGTGLNGGGGGGYYGGSGAENRGGAGAGGSGYIGGVDAGSMITGTRSGAGLIYITPLD